MLLLLLLLLLLLMLFLSFHLGIEAAEGQVKTIPEKGRKELFIQVQNVFDKALVSNQFLDHIFWGSNNFRVKLEFL